MIFLLPDTASDITVEWVGEADAWTARIYPGRKLFAKLMNGGKTGLGDWVRLATKDEPLARVLSR
jgi:hypothetical protein